MTYSELRAVFKVLDLWNTEVHGVINLLIIRIDRASF